MIRRQLVKSVLSFHVFMAYQDEAQVLRLVWEAPLPAEPSLWLLRSLEILSQHCKDLAPTEGDVVDGPNPRLTDSWLGFSGT